jgi:hypothetical protein
MYAWYTDENWVSEARCDKQEYNGPPCIEEGSDTESEESDEEFGWYSKDIDNQTYFVFVNNNRKAFQKGKEVFYCYGNRSSKYLLINYGFTFANNRYASYPINLRMDIDLKHP